MHAPIQIDGACVVADRGLILASGADAATFLQGQLTNDVLGLTTGQARLAGFCSAKGRLQASFLVWRHGPDDFVLMCAADVLAATLKRLSMFVMRAKCRLSDASALHDVRGLAGPSADALVADMAVWDRRDAQSGAVIRLPDAAGVRRALHVAPSGATAERVAYFLGRKERSALSSRTNARQIDAARATLLAQMAALID